MAFDLLQKPHVTRLAPFRFAHVRVRGPYEPWARVQALDTVAEMLEKAEVDRVGPAFGIYHDLPASLEEPEAWRADLGYPIGAGARVPRTPGLRVKDVEEMDIATLRYVGDLGSFPSALQLLGEWIEGEGIDAQGCLLERFHVSDALTGAEERDVMVALDPIDP